MALFANRNCPPNSAVPNHQVSSTLLLQDIEQDRASHHSPKILSLLISSLFPSPFLLSLLPSPFSLLPSPFSLLPFPFLLSPFSFPSFPLSFLLSSTEREKRQDEKVHK